MDFTPFNVPSKPKIQIYREIINRVSLDYRVPSCAVAAIVERESGGDNIFEIGFPPGPGCGVGLTQITSGVEWGDLKNPTYDNGSYHLMIPEDNVIVCCKFFLAPAIKDCLLLRENPGAYSIMQGISPEILFFAFATYNAGFGTVSEAIYNLDNIDNITTNEYATSVLALYHDNLRASKSNA